MTRGRLAGIWIGCVLPLACVGAQIPAFPGAEGYGAYAAGGRGGDVYHVTTLASSGAGSFANAIATVPSVGRTIIFDVSGYIRFPSGSGGTRLTASKVTIAGQTAPGDGIGFYNNFFRISGDDVVLRHLRFRRGKTDAGGDCIDLDSGCLNAVLDHLSVQFSTDENISSFSSPPENFTLQYSLNSWGLESHSCGGLWDQNNATSHHNLWSHNHTRNPKARPGMLEWINNVTFDWDIGFIMGDSQTSMDWKSNVIGNYFIGPSGNTHSKALVKGTVADNGKPNFTVYLENNLIDINGDGTLNGVNNGYGIVEGTGYAPGTSGLTPGAAGYYQALGALGGSAAGVSTDSPLLAYKKIVSSAGALRLDASYSGALRDEVDTILIGKLTSQSRGHVSSESGTGASNYGWGVLGSALPLADTDRDGAPDLYENAVGMNAGADDHNTAFSAGAISGGSTFFPTNSPAGYTYLEEYLHFKASPHAYVAKNTASAPTYADADLARYTSGFTKPTVTFSLSNVANGSAVLQGDGHTVRFTPALNFSGRARFDFTVTDGDGASWTQRFCLLVTAAGIPKNLLWRGDGTANVWDTTTANWLKSGAPALFDTSDTVTFDDSGTNTPSITISSTVTPGAITVNAAQNYTLIGAGSLSGTASILKSGAGTLTIGVSAANSGGTDFDGGCMVLSKPGSTGSGAIRVGGNVVLTSAYGVNDTLTMNGSVTVPDGGVLALNLSQRTEVNGALSGNGAVNVYAPSTLGTEGRDYWDAPSATFAGTLAISGGGSGRLAARQNGGGFNGFNSARLSLEDVNLFTANYSAAAAGGSFKIGSLSGNAGAVMRGCYNAGGNVTTWMIGGLNADSTFAGSIRDGSASATAVVKEGSGTLTLSGTNTYTSATTVSNGALMVNGALGVTLTTVVGGATLAGGGAIGGNVTVQAGGIIAPGGAPGAAGSLGVGTNLTLASPTLRFDLSSAPAGANDRLTLSGGLLTMSGSQTYQFNLLDGVLGAGTYTLIEGGANTSASGVSLLHNLPANSRQSFQLQRPASGNGQCYVRLAVGGSAAALVWKGTNAVGAVWDSAVTNWVNGSAADKFYNFDAVTFNDTGANGSVMIGSTVSPRALTVTNATTAYTFGGTNGSIAGSTTLVKSGAGTLTINTTNSYSGGTLLNGGTVQLGNDSANAYGLGTGAIIFNGGTLKMYDNDDSYNSATYTLSVPAGQTGTLHADSRCDIYGTLLGSGIFNVRVPWVRTELDANWSAFAGTLNLVTDGDGGDLRMGTDYAFAGFPNADVTLADKVALYHSGILSAGAGTTIPIGSLSGSTFSTLMGGVTVWRNLTYRIGGKGTDATFAGTIREQNTLSNSTSIIKTGAGVWTLGGANNTWNGGTVVEEGALRISGAVSCGEVLVQEGAALSLTGGSLASDSINVSAGALLSGNGHMVGDLNNDGTVTCDSGVLTITGNVVNNGTMRFTGGSGIAVDGAGNTFVNNGLLDLISGLQSLPQNLENNGTVLDAGNVVIAEADLSATTFRVSIAGYTGHSYQVQWRASLSEGTWVNVGDAQPGDGGAPLHFSAPSASGAKGFYRILVIP